MAVLYVDTPGTVVGKQGDTVTLRNDSVTASSVPFCHVDQVLLVGNVQVSSQALASFLKQGISVSYLSGTGAFRGKLTPPAHKNVFLRLGQYQKYHDPEFRMSMSRLITWSKMKNCQELIHKHQRTHPEVELRHECEEIKLQMAHVWRAESLDVLMGYEGNGARHYFTAFGKMVRKSEFPFTGRNRRPPRDDVNALLSLGYTLLYNEFLAAVEAIGFDPYLGFFHEVHYSHAALASDLMEEFRFLVDSLVLASINRGVLTPDDFTASPDGEGRYLTSPGRKKFYPAYEQKMQTEVAYRGTNVSYRRVFHHQAEHLARVVRGEEYLYEPYLTK